MSRRTGTPTAPATNGGSRSTTSKTSKGSQATAEECLSCSSAGKTTSASPRLKRAYTKRAAKWKLAPMRILPPDAERFAAAMAIVLRDYELSAEVTAEAMNIAARLPDK